MDIFVLILSVRVTHHRTLIDPGRTKDARREYETCIEFAPDVFEANANFALFLHQLGDSTAALDQFQVMCKYIRVANTTVAFTLL